MAKDKEKKKGSKKGTITCERTYVSDKCSRNGIQQDGRRSSSSPPNSPIALRVLDVSCKHRRRGAVREKRPVSLDKPRPAHQRVDNAYVETPFAKGAASIQMQQNRKQQQKQPKKQKKQRQKVAALFSSIIVDNTEFTPSSVRLICNDCQPSCSTNLPVMKWSDEPPPRPGKGIIDEFPPYVPWKPELSEQLDSCAVCYKCRCSTCQMQCKHPGLRVFGKLDVRALCDKEFIDATIACLPYLEKTPRCKSANAVRARATKIAKEAPTKTTSAAATPAKTAIAKTSSTAVAPAKTVSAGAITAKTTAAKTAPTKTASTAAPPAKTAIKETAPTKTATIETAFAKTAPVAKTATTETAIKETAPTKTATIETAFAKTAPVAKTATAETAIKETASAAATPEITVPAKTAITKTAIKETASAAAAPEITVPAKTAITKTATAKTAIKETASAAAAPEITVPAKTAIKETAPAKTALAAAKQVNGAYHDEDADSASSIKCRLRWMLCCLCSPCPPCHMADEPLECAAGCRGNYSVHGCKCVDWRGIKRNTRGNVNVSAAAASESRDRRRCHQYYVTALPKKKSIFRRILCL